MPKKDKKPIKIDSLLKSRIKATRRPPGSTIGLLEAYKQQKDSLTKKDSIRAANDSLQRVIIELKTKQKK